MSNEEIRKLLGGYATNTLTESERKELFEAALEDQELFNALQQEEALKGLLADPGTRAQVRAALDRQPSGRWTGRTRWWVWGGAVSAVATAVVLLVVFVFRPGAGERPAQIAMAEKAATPAAQVEEQKAVPNQTSKELPPKKARGTRTAIAQDRIAAAPAAAPPSIIPPPVQAQAVESTQAKAPVVNALASLQEPALKYSLLKRGVSGQVFAPASVADLQRGDLVRFQVSTTVPGNLILSRLDEAGEWQRITEVAVLANSGYTIPDLPIQVQASAQKYRLALETSAAKAETLGGIAGGPKRAMRAASSVPSSPPAAASIEISIPGKPAN